MQVKTEIPESKLLDKPQDMRRKPYKDIVIFSPVGDMAQLDGFAKHVKELGIDKDADFLFIYRQGLEYKDYGLSALSFTEKMPIGTSGCFFAGQAMSYALGYETIVVADLDAFLDSKKTFDGMIAQAKQSGKAIVPLSKSPKEEKPLPNYFVVNQWGVFPRAVFEKVGFEIPYTYKGGEDWEFSNRLKHYGQVNIYKDGHASHEKIGMGIKEKLKNPKKYYPYLKGLMIAFSVSWQYDWVSYLRFFAWFCYYNTYAIMLEDKALTKTVRLQNFKNTEIKTNGLANPGIMTIFIAAFSVPLTMLGAAATIMSIRQKRKEIPTARNWQEITL